MVTYYAYMAVSEARTMRIGLIFVSFVIACTCLADADSDWHAALSNQVAVINQAAVSNQQSVLDEKVVMDQAAVNNQQAVSNNNVRTEGVHKTNLNGKVKVLQQKYLDREKGWLFTEPPIP